MQANTLTDCPACGDPVADTDYHAECEWARTHPEMQEFLEEERLRRAGL